MSVSDRGLGRAPIAHRIGHRVKLIVAMCGIGGGYPGVAASASIAYKVREAAPGLMEIKWTS
jgi:hypothetical protein